MSDLSPDDRSKEGNGSVFTMLKGFGLSDYRSFSDEGFFLDNLKKLNVVIGKNNCGKSNVLGAIKALSGLSHPNPLPPDGKGLDEHHIKNKPKGKAALVRAALLTNVLLPREPERIATNLGPTITGGWRAGPSDKLEENPFDAIRDPDLLHTCCEMNSIQNLARKSPDEKRDELGRVFMRQANSAFRELSPVLFVPEYRNLSSNDEGGITFTGGGLIRRLQDMRTPPFGQEYLQEQFRKIEAFVAELLGLDRVILEIPGNLDLLVGIDGNRFRLQSYGTGIHHLVILCAAMAIHEKHVVLIEEPEAHLHPDLQRRFLRFILEKTSNTYFISTHSNVFLDAGVSGSIYHVTHNGSETQLCKIETPSHTRGILSDMGFKASDLLQSNCVIWVEGPSDRLYIRKWLEMFDSSLSEDLHYSFVFYGGAVLSHFTADEVGDYIKILRINRHAFVVMDHDGEEGSPLAERKQRVVNELNDDRAWVTQGREIENYLKPALLYRVYKEKYAEIEKAEFGKFEHIEEFVKAHGGPSSFDKVEIAHRAVACMQSGDLEVHDLKDKLALITKCIRLANHM